jgi:hypothetical protein
MRSRARFLIALMIPVAVMIGLACSGPYGNPCTTFGGTCVASATQCGGILPYDCSGAICCESTLVQGDALPTPDAPASTTGDSSSVMQPGVDAATKEAAVSMPDAPVVGMPDVASLPDTGSVVPDTGAPASDAAADVGTPGADAAPTSDASGVDASSHDAAPDVATTHDAGTTPDAGTSHDTGAPSDANPGCAAYAAPNTPSTCHGCTGSQCQTNGCFGGYYCHTTTDKCVKPSSVTCN